MHFVLFPQSLVGRYSYKYSSPRSFRSFRHTFAQFSELSGTVTFSKCRLALNSSQPDLQTSSQALYVAYATKT